MSDITLEKKFYLKNKYLNKIIKNIADVNNYLKLLNNFNHKMIRQYGGFQEEFDKLNTGLNAEAEKIRILHDSSEKQIQEINQQQQLLITNINEIQNLVEKIPVKSTHMLDDTNIMKKLNDLENKIIGKSKEEKQESAPGQAPESVQGQAPESVQGQAPGQASNRKKLKSGLEKK